MSAIITGSYLEEQLKLLGFRAIKACLGRQRLRLSFETIAFYLLCISQHQAEHVHFKRLYAKADLSITYAAFMHGVQTVAPLAKVLFFAINRKAGIGPSKLLNMIDSSLLPEKQPGSIRSRDWAAGRVTTRSNAGVKSYICGSKLLCFMNRQGFVYYAKHTGINHSDFNVLKDTAYHSARLRGILLADRGFNSALVRERLKGQPQVRLISPPHKASKSWLSPKESKLYKYRWRIETLFQRLKDPYGNFKLNLTSRLTKILNEAKLFITLTTYNLAQ